MKIRTQIIDALMTGNEVCAALIAKQIKCAPESANTVLRSLSKYLEKRPAPEEPGKNRIYYRAADRDGLMYERDMRRRKVNQHTPAECELNFDALLRAWHIKAPRGCTLPVVIHRMETEEDQQIEEAA